MPAAVFNNFTVHRQARLAEYDHRRGYNETAKGHEEHPKNDGRFGKAKATVACQEGEEALERLICILPGGTKHKFRLTSLARTPSLVILYRADVIQDCGMEYVVK